MLRRNLFALVVLLGLILSAAFTSWTQDTSDAGKKSGLPPVSSSPPDLTDYARPAIPGDLAASQTLSPSKGATALSDNSLSSPGFFVVEVPNSGGGEPDIAINPTNLNQIVIHEGFGGWNGNATNFVSNDGGITWTASNQIPPPTGITITSGPNDITQDYGLDGNLYGAYLTGVPAGGACAAPNFDVFSASNTNPIFGGLFNYFTTAGAAQMTNFNGAAGCADQPWLLTNVDPTTPGQTNTYVAYDDDSGNNLRVSAALGTQPPQFVTDKVSGLYFGGGTNQGLRLAVDPRTGAIYSLYQGCTSNCGGSPKGIAYVLNRSLDAGTTWTLNGSGTGITVATGTTVQPTPKFGTVNALLGGIDHAAVDPTTSDVFVAFGGDNGSGGNAVFIVQITFDNSSPTKALIGTPHQVSLPGAQAALPSVAVAPNGTVGVLYTSFDGFDVSGFPIFSGHFAYSTDAGVTFTDQTLLTFLSPAKDNGDSRQRVLGDYQQLKVVNDLPNANAGATFYGVFTGNGAALGDPTAGNQAIFFKVTLAPQINLNPNPLAIGPVCEGSTGVGQLEVSDTGADNLLVSSITKTSGSADISLAAGPSFPVNISPDANFNFTFDCTPTAFGAKSATFNIASNDPASPNTAVTVTCNTAAGTINVTGSGNFGTASCSGSTPPQTLKINNVGTCNLNVTSAIISCADFTLVNPGEFPATISPDSSLDVGINFTPTSAGPKSCTLTINSDDPSNPVVVVPLTANTPLGTASLTFPAGITFPPTVIQASGACSSTLGVPIANSGACPVQINSVGLTQTSTSPPGLDYSLTGLPTLPVSVPAGGQLGSGDFDLVFAPFALAQFSSGTVDVTFVNDPITGATTTTHVPFCGEGVHRGLRVLVTQGGVPVPVVKRIKLQRAHAPEQQGPIFTLPRTIKNATLQTIPGTAPCPTIMFHGDFGDVGNPFQLKDGTYRIKVTLKIGKKIKHKAVRVNMDQCTFTPDVVVAFP
jgi:HYDIN/CFA65/VesB-like, Ig-like domain